MNWKILAIILTIILLLENFLFGLGWYLTSQDEKKINECYWDICSGYVDADFLSNVCYCYDYDTLGSLVVAKTEFMG